MIKVSDEFTSDENPAIQGGVFAWGLPGVWLGAAAAWFVACAGGRVRDGEQRRIGEGPCAGPEVRALGRREILPDMEQRWLFLARSHEFLER
jgi:hypothetical protein